MAGGKTVSLSDDLAHMLDEEVRHISATSGVETTRGKVAASIIKPELERRRLARYAESQKRGKK